MDETSDLPNLSTTVQGSGDYYRLFLYSKDPADNMEVELRTWYGFSDEEGDYPTFVVQLKEKGERGAGLDWWAIPLDQESTFMLADAFERLSKALRSFAEYEGAWSDD